MTVEKTHARFRALIVDDEKLACLDLAAILLESGRVEITGQAHKLSTAREMVKTAKPDLVFLDIDLSGESGFDLLNDIPPDIQVVFVTAYNNYAVKAFEVDAVDYLLKPVSAERLALTLDRLDKTAERQIVSKKLNSDDVIFLLLDSRYKFLKIKTILAVTAADDYTELLLSGGEKVLANKTMKEWENRLPADCFQRIHRSTIINIECVDRIEPWFNSSYRVYLKEIAEPFDMSKRYFSAIKDKCT